MAGVDEFSQTLFEEAKRFLEKARAEKESKGKSAYLHAAFGLTPFSVPGAMRV